MDKIAIPVACHRTSPRAAPGSNPYDDLDQARTALITVDL